MIPCIGAGITIIIRAEHGPWRGKLLRAYVERVDEERTRIYAGLVPPRIYWRSGTRTGHVRLTDEGIEWIQGHGPRARKALVVARAL